MKKQNHKIKTDNGFTLIEMMVSVSIFAVVITVAMAAFLNVSDIQNKAASFRAVNDNLNFALEVMTRDIRTGRDYCSPSCPSSSSFNFTSVLGKKIVYLLDGGTIKKSIDGGTPMSLTSNEVKIDNLQFFVNGTAALDGYQPIVTIIINGFAGKKETTLSRLNLQATVSQREMDS